MKKTVFACLLVCLCQCTQREKTTLDGYVELELKLTGKKYTQLVLCTPYLAPEGWAIEKEFPGLSEDGYNWKFSVPDSINEIAEGYTIRIYPYDFENNQGGEIVFTQKGFPDNKVVRGIVLEGKKTLIEGSYRGEREEYYGGMGYLFSDTYVEDPTLIYNLFDIKLEDKKNKKYSEFELNFYCSDFSSLPEINYEEALQQRIAFVKEYPDSKYLFDQFAYSTGYKNRNDMKLVFDNFSKKMKSSDFGKQIAEHLSRQIIPVDVFTEQLTNSKTNQLEAVIIHPSKPTFIVFSASWCGPCHKLIPQLKKMYNELSPIMDMVYISMDKKNIETWKELMTNVSHLFLTH